MWTAFALVSLFALSASAHPLSTASLAHKIAQEHVHRRHLQTQEELDLLCALLSEGSEGELVCTCNLPTLSCDSTQPQCEDGVCYDFTTNFSFSDDFANIDDLSVCIHYVSGAPEGLEDGCVSFGFTNGLLSSCA